MNICHRHSRLCPISWLLALLFASNFGLATAVAESRSAIFTMNLDGTDLKNIGEVKNNRSQTWPRWSPNGREVAFDATVRGADVRIYKVPAEGGKPVSLGPGRMAAWSPDGKQLLFTIPPRHPSGSKAGVWIMNADGNGRQWLFPGEGAAFSPVGDRISYISNHEGSDALYLYDIVEGTSKKVPLPGYSQLSGSAVWSPNGQQLCFTGIREGNPMELAIVDLGATTAEKPIKVRLTGKNFAKHPTWAPSEMIYLWLKMDDGALKLHFVDPKSDAPPQLIKNRDSKASADAHISSDGKKIVFASVR